MKKIFINASTVKYSGGLVVALDAIGTFLQMDQIEYCLVCPNLPYYKRFELESNVNYVPKQLLKPVFRPYLDYGWIQQVIKDFKPDLIISLGNLPVKSKIPQIHFNDNAFYSVDKLSNLGLGFMPRLKHLFRRRLFFYRLKFVRRVYVQTVLEQGNLTGMLQKKIPIRVLPPLLPFYLRDVSPKNAFFPGSNIKLICLNKYYPHKNIEFLLDAASHIKEADLKITISITLGRENSKVYSKISNEIKKRNVKSIISLIDEVDFPEIPRILSDFDGLVLPSEIETVGLNCLDAWASSKPIFISDKKWSRAFCGDAAFYFDNHNSQSFIYVIKKFFESDSVQDDYYKAIPNALSQLGSEQSWQEAIREELNL